MYYHTLGGVTEQISLVDLVRRKEPAQYTELAERVKRVFLENEETDISLARSRAMRVVVENCPIGIADDDLIVGGDEPFFFNLMFPALQSDRYARGKDALYTLEDQTFIGAACYWGPCFDGHITPGLEMILAFGLCGLEERAREHRALHEAQGCDQMTLDWYDAALESIDNIRIYTRRLHEAAIEYAAGTGDEEYKQVADILTRVPERPARTFREALQSYWIVYILVTVEMGGCVPGGGLGLGRMDQYLYPYYRRDLDDGEVTRDEALSLMEMFLLNFRHIDYFTPHAICTPGSQTSLGGVTPEGLPAHNELTELIMEASVRIDMPAPYISLRLYKDAPEDWWEMCARYIRRGLGFPVVNDEANIPAFLRHGRSLSDARDYICSCCYENTIPGREAFHPNGSYLNLPKLLEMTLFGGESLLGKACLPDVPVEFAGFEEFLSSYLGSVRRILRERILPMVTRIDRFHCESRRYPMMSLFFDECLVRGVDICAGGSRYSLVGIIVSGLPNAVNSLYSLKKAVFEEKVCTLDELRAAVRDNFEGHELLRARLMAYEKWGNAIPEVDTYATDISETLYDAVKDVLNGRGGRYQLALYSFIANHLLGEKTAALPDGRLSGESLTRNLNPAWGTDRGGPTLILGSLSAIDFTKFPDGSSLDLRFDPAVFEGTNAQKFIAFLKGFVDLKVMQMQISMVDRETLLDARKNPERHQNLMVKVAGYSARFVDLTPLEQEELINRTTQSTT